MTNHIKANVANQLQTLHKLTIIADSNIAGLEDFFNPQMLGFDASTAGTDTDQTIEVVSVAGRDISVKLLAEKQPDVLLTRSVTPINAALLADNHSVKFVGSTTIGTDHVDQDYLTKKGIRFANAAGCSKHSVAQYVLSAILTLRPQYWGQSMTLGIVGLGNIGSTLTQYATDLGWQILGYDPLVPESAFNNASFEQVLSQSDVISLHVPLTHARSSDYPTHHLIDVAALEIMSSDTLLINSARGAVIDNAALETDIAQKGRQVVLDVFESEPEVAASLLTKLAIATPHIAGYTLEGKLRGTQLVYDALCSALDIAPIQSMQQLMPVNMYLWPELKAHPDKLATFYDIRQDDEQLRAKAADGGVRAADFDQLRRDYHLRREWQFGK